MKQSSKFCHRCEYDGQGHDACLTCRGFAEAINGANTSGEVSIDAGAETFLPHDRKAEAIRFAGEPDPAAVVGDLTPEQTARLVGFFTRWLQMHPSTRDAVAARLAGHELLSITATRLSCTVQNVSKSVRKAARRVPEIGAVLNLKPSKRRVKGVLSGPSGDLGCPAIAGPLAETYQSVVPEGGPVNG